MKSFIQMFLILTSPLRHIWELVDRIIWRTDLEVTVQSVKVGSCYEFMENSLGSQSTKVASRVTLLSGSDKLVCWFSTLKIWLVIFEWASQFEIRITDPCWYRRDRFRTSFSHTSFSYIWTILLTTSNKEELFEIMNTCC